MLKMSRGGKITNTEELEELANILNQRMQNKEGGANRRLAIMLGMLTKDSEVKANIPSEDRSNFSLEKYKFLLFAPFLISNKCCNVMKKKPLKSVKMHPITAQMADESKLRTQKWLQHGCNMFDGQRPISNPMSFWTTQDIYLYIRLYSIDIPSVYGQVLMEDELSGQMNIFTDLLGYGLDKLEEFDRPYFKTTGVERTGCIFCGFGLHLEKGKNRFEHLYETHKKLAEYVLGGGEFKEDGMWKPNEKGLGMWFIIEYLNKYGGFKINIPDRDRFIKEFSTSETRKYLEEQT